MTSGSRPGVAFLFPGQGAQWPAMTRQLAAAQPVVRHALQACAAGLREFLDVPLLDLLEREDLLAETQYTQPALFAVEWALAALWRAWGVEPSAVIGHSVGEYAAACVAGVMDLDDALRLIAARGRLMAERTARGAMAAVFADVTTVADMVARHAGVLAVAAVNGPDSVVVSGDASALTALLDELSGRGIRARRLVVSHAFHSPLMDPMLEEFARVAATVTYHVPRLALISNVTGAVAGAEVASPEYWVRHVRQPVQFAAGVRALGERGARVLLEVGPGTTLVGLARRAAADGTFAAVPTLRAGSDESLSVAEAVGHLWTAGVAVDWPRYQEHAGGRRISLPTYPFQRERHWVAREPGRRLAPAARRDERDHPLLGHRLVEASASGVSVWEGTLDLATFPYLADHRVQGRVIVPATAYLEMVVAAATEAFGARPLTMSGIRLNAPLALDGDTVARTQTVIAGSLDRDMTFAVQSRAIDAAGVEAGGWTLHASGRLALDDEADTPTLDLAAARARCAEEVAGDEFYRRLAARGNDWGPCFRGLAHVWRGPDEAVAEIRAPEALAADLERYRFHPALADAAGHALAATIPLEASAGLLGGAFVGGALDRFVFRRAPRGRLFSYARRRAVGGSGNVLTGDVRLVDGSGAIVAEVQGARLWYLAGGAAAMDDTLARRLYAIQWQPVPVAATSSAGRERWLIFTDAGGVGAAVASRLSADGAGCVLVQPGDRYEQLDRGRFLVRPGDRDDVRRLVDTVVGTNGSVGIVHLWSLDAKVGPDATAGELEAAHRLGCGSILPLVQELAAARRPGPAPLWLVTRGAQPAGGLLAADALPAATVWGMGRTLAVEHADLWGGLVDLDPSSPAEDAAASLGAQLLAADGEDQVAFRNGERFVARLVRTSGPGAQRGTRWRPDASYLVTGGLGGLGLQVARWMVEQGARRIVLLGRSGLPPRADWSAVDPASRAGRRIAAVRDLEALGASVHLGAVDVADEPALREFLETFRREGWPSIRGVVHAAGTVHYGPLVQTTAAQLDDVLRSKVAGAWLLHRLLAGEALDFFVLFSSASGVLSSPLVGAYAAANAFLDALAHRRASEGRAALSIDWGLWAGAGMAEQVGAEGLAALTARGMGSLSPEQALEALGAFLGSSAVQVGVIPVNWPVWRERYPMFTAAPFLAEVLAAETAPAAAAAADGAREDLLSLEPVARAEAVLTRLRAHAGAVLRLDPSTIDVGEPLTSFGIDSLMAVELKNRVDRDLGLSVPLVHYLDGSDLGRLAEVLLDNVDAGHRTGGTPETLDTAAAAELLTRLDEPRGRRRRSLAARAFARRDEPVTERTRETESGSDDKRARLAELLRRRAGRDDSAHPLSHGQQALWFLHQLVPGTAAYNVVFSARVRSRLDVAALARALRELVSRHPILRATFEAREGRPVQRLRVVSDVTVEEIDAHGLAADALAAALAETAQRPFDLQAEPLVRAAVFTQAADDHVLVLAVHHLVVDGWSFGLLLDDLFQLYAHEAGGDAPPPAAAPAQYLDFVRWQSEMLASAEGTRLRTYWNETLSGELPVLDLPTDRPRPAVVSLRGSSVGFTLDEALTASLKRLAAAESTTPFVVMLAALQALLSRYTGQTDVLVGSPVAGRGRAAFERIVGNCMNMVALRGDLSDDPSFRSFVGHMRGRVLGALAHQDYPFPLVVEALKADRDLSRMPVFQVTFNYLRLQTASGVAALIAADAGDAAVEVGGLRLQSCPLPQQEGQFDLALEMTEVGPRLQGRLKYDAALFDASTVTRMAGHFETLLRGAVATPERTISELPLLTEPERRQILVEWNRTERPYPRSSACTSCSRRRWRARRTRSPCSSSGEHLTYRDLDERANQLARVLVARGVGPDVLVGVCMERSLELVVALLGVAQGRRRLRAARSRLPGGSPRVHARRTPRPPWSSRRRTCARVLPPARRRGRRARRRAGAALAGEQHRRPIRNGVAGDDLAYVIYTSGSTGRPKGAMNTHRGVVNRLLWMQEAYGLGADDRVLQKTPFSFDVSVWEFFWPLLAGARLVVARPEGHRDPRVPGRPDRAAQGITTLHFVPSMLQVFLDEPDVGRAAARCGG